MAPSWSCVGAVAPERGAEKITFFSRLRARGQTAERPAPVTRRMQRASAGRQGSGGWRAVAERHGAHSAASSPASSMPTARYLAYLHARCLRARMMHPMMDTMRASGAPKVMRGLPSPPPPTSSPGACQLEACPYGMRDA